MHGCSMVCSPVIKAWNLCSGSPARNVLETIRSSMQSRLSIITPRDVILNQGESEDTSMEVVIQVQNLNQAEQEKTSPKQDGMSQDHHPKCQCMLPASTSSQSLI